MMKISSRVSNAAVQLVKVLTKKAEKEGKLRSDVFIEVDKRFGYIAGSTAKHIGKIESTISKHKKVLRKNYGNVSLTITPIKKEGKVYRTRN